MEDDQGSKTALSRVFNFARTCGQAYTETISLLFKHSKAVAFEGGWDFAYFLIDVPDKVLARIHTLRLELRHEAGLACYCDVGFGKWRNLSGLR